MTNANLSPENQALLRRTVTQNLSNDEHALFLRAHEQTGLDPFGRFLYVARDRGKFRIESTIDGFRLTAERTGKYAGQIGPQWCGPDGVWKSVWTSKEPPTAARVGILRSDFKKPIWGKALYSEYVQPGDFWVKMAANQLAKCAEALGFRKAFPERFSGLYTSDEMAQSSSLLASGVGANMGAGHHGPQTQGGQQTNAEPAQAGLFSNSGIVAAETQPRRLVLLNGDAGSIPERGGDDGPSLPAVPLPLQGFIQPDGSVGDHRNVSAAFRFIEGEFTAALGEAGRDAFRSIRARMPKVFKSREACIRGTLQCWCELWDELAKAQQQSEAA